MPFTHKILRTYDDGAKVFTASEAVSNGGELNLSETIPGGSSNMQLTFSFTKAKLKSFFITCDRPIDVYTNDASGGSPQEHIALTAGQELLWSANDAPFLPNPFAGNVTTLYVTLAAGASATLDIRGQVDPAT